MTELAAGRAQPRRAVVFGKSSIPELAGNELTSQLYCKFPLARPGIRRAGTDQEGNTRGRLCSGVEFKTGSLLKGGTGLHEACETATEADGLAGLKALLREPVVWRLIVDVDPADGGCA